MLSAILITAAWLPSPSILQVGHTRGDIHMSAAPEGARKFKVFLQNDDFNMREYVARVLMMVCYVTESEATSIMMEANRDRWKNRALCGIWEEPVARHVYTGLKRAGLSAILTPDDDVEHNLEPCMVMQDEAGACDDDSRPRYLDGTLIESDEDLPRYYQ